jgi:signal transduction histidine kinase
LWVEDNGIGIAPEHQGRIFEMFNRLQDQYEGTGIGLTIVRKAVERMGGQVGLESTPGEGTRFWIQLKSAALKTPEVDARDTALLSHASDTV